MFYLSHDIKILKKMHLGVKTSRGSLILRNVIKDVINSGLSIYCMALYHSQTLRHVVKCYLVHIMLLRNMAARNNIYDLELE